MVRSKEIKTTAFFYPILLHWLNIISWLLYFALLKQYRVMVGCSPFITVPLCCYLLLTLFSCMGLLLWWQSFPALLWSPAWTVEECLLWCLEHLLSLLLWPCFFTELFLTLFSPQYSLCLCSLFLFLICTSTEALPAWLMEPAGISCPAQGSPSFSLHFPPQQPPHYRQLGTHIQYKK